MPVDLVPRIFMSVYVHEAGSVTERNLPADKTAAGVLTEEEREKVTKGELVVTTPWDGPMGLEASVREGQSLVLRPAWTPAGLEAGGHRMTFLDDFYHYCENCGGLLWGPVGRKAFHTLTGSAKECVGHPTHRTLAEKLQNTHTADMEHLREI